MCQYYFSVLFQVKIKKFLNRENVVEFLNTLKKSNTILSKEIFLCIGCGQLESDWWTSKRKKPDVEVTNAEDARLWIGSPGFDGQPACGANTYAPEAQNSIFDYKHHFSSSRNNFNTISNSTVLAISVSTKGLFM